MSFKTVKNATKYYCTEQEILHTLGKNKIARANIGFKPWVLKLSMPKHFAR